ncbi:MAG: acyl-CoA dehydrogenase family protein [Candidatus Tectomicrobia bacterium]|uniref:Acyl-CoA dehydrogenase family protein n=1 Tax=Tectimicrobiota bacterium TaxID=2528274 RepID=A0A933LRT6_UNCTE|nr:acyl-CoA dehydrogenase family protein [Candidatus Tectomicrobia bacterium]
MVDFGWSEDQEQFRQSLRKFARNELAPKYGPQDRNREFPVEQLHKMANMGLFGLRVPVEYGGLGADCVTAGIAVEEIARGDFNCATPIMIAGIGAEIIGQFGTEEQKRWWLPSIATGEKTVAVSLTEAEAGSDAASLKMRAIRDGDYYILNGEKSSTTMNNADFFFVFARTDVSQQRARGISAFLVPRDLQGISTSVYKDLGCKSIPRGPVVFNDTKVPAQYLIGPENRGFLLVMNSFDYNRVLIALTCLAVAEQSLEETLQYVKDRKAFGRSLAKFEGISFPLAEAATLIEAARLLCYEALWLRDRKLPHTKEAAMTKWWVPKISVEIVHQCLLFHGHYGYTEEFPFEQRLRDALGSQIGDGTAEIQKIVIARELMGREFLPY